MTLRLRRSLLLLLFLISLGINLGLGWGLDSLTPTWAQSAQAEPRVTIPVQGPPRPSKPSPTPQPSPKPSAKPATPKPTQPTAGKPSTAPSPKPTKPISANPTSPPPAPAPFPTLPRQEIRGVWVTKNDMDVLLDQPRLQQALTQLAQLNFNTVYPVVWNSGYMLYPSALGEREGIPYIHRGNQGQDAIADVIAQGHRQGLLVMPWFEFGFMAPPTSEIALNHPDWLTQDRNGNEYGTSAAGEVVWFNPFKPEVQKFITDLVMEVVNRYDVDGIQFDDHFSLPSEFGYDPYTVSLYRQETGKTPPANHRDPDWLKWRADKITAFVVQLNRTIKARKPAIAVSVSPNPYETAYRAHLQDWLTWVRRGLVDEIIVQIYRPDLQSFLAQVNRPEIQETSQKISTAVGVLTGLRRRPVPMRQIIDQTLAAHNRGLGVSYFFYESLWDDAPEQASDRQAGFRALFASPAPRLARR